MHRPEIMGETFNFSNESPITVLEMVHKIWELMGKSYWQPQVRHESKNEIEHQSLSAAKARKLLNWAPQYSLEAGLKETIQWYKAVLETEENSGAGVREVSLL